MIFKRRRKQAESPAEPDELVAGDAAAESDVGDSGESDRDQPDAAGADAFDAEALDAAEWRADGPYDVTEVGLDGQDDGQDDEEGAGGDEDSADTGQPRIDLGSMLVTGFPGAELRLQVSEESQQVVSVMLIGGDSAIELGAYAAPAPAGSGRSCARS